MSVMIVETYIPQQNLLIRFSFIVMSWLIGKVIYWLSYTSDFHSKPKKKPTFSLGWEEILIN